MTLRSPRSVLGSRDSKMERPAVRGFRADRAVLVESHFDGLVYLIPSRGKWSSAARHPRRLGSCLRSSRTSVGNARR